MDDFERITRETFDKQQRLQDGDDRVFSRLANLVTEEYFGLSVGAFHGLDILDAGCGTNANASHAFLARGARNVVSLELGHSWMDCAKRRLAKFGARSSLAAGSVLDLPFDRASFDFVHCAGVLPHTSDPRLGFSELARVTRPDGLLFLTIMGTGNGILYICINHLREKYASDPSFRSAVDGLTSDRVSEHVNWLLTAKSSREGELIKGENDVFRSLFDEDLLITIKDRLQAPTYHAFGFTEKQIVIWFDEEGFEDIRRISRYTFDFHNLRRFLAPMYENFDHSLARFWFGDGCIQMIGRKRSRA